MVRMGENYENLYGHRVRAYSQSLDSHNRYTDGTPPTSPSRNNHQVLGRVGGGYVSGPEVRTNSTDTRNNPLFRILSSFGFNNSNGSPARNEFNVDDERVTTFIDHIDTDGDGVISQEESNRAFERFIELDLEDGTIDGRNGETRLFAPPPEGYEMPDRNAASAEGRYLDFTQAYHEQHNTENESERDFWENETRENETGRSDFGTYLDTKTEQRAVSVAQENARRAEQARSTTEPQPQTTTDDGKGNPFVGPAPAPEESTDDNRPDPFC